VPAVALAPVDIIAVFNVPMLAVVTFALAIVAVLVTVANRTVIVSAVSAFVIVALFDAMFPVTTTVPNVVVPVLPDCASANHAFAFAVPSAGQTYNVLALVLYHN
jgi:hypothetical protein